MLVWDRMFNIRWVIMWGQRGPSFRGDANVFEGCASFEQTSIHLLPQPPRPALLEDSKMLQDHLRDIVCPTCPGSSSVSLPLERHAGSILTDSQTTSTSSSWCGETPSLSEIFELINLNGGSVTTAWTKHTMYITDATIFQSFFNLFIHNRVTSFEPEQLFTHICLLLEPQSSNIQNAT